jgi:hypothetical protein
MKRGIRFSRRPAAAAVASLTALLVALGFHLHASAAAAAEARRSASHIEELSRRTAADAAYDDPALGELRDRIERFRRELGTTDALSRLAGQLGSRWSLGSARALDRGLYRVHQASASLTAPEVSDWPAIVEAVREAEDIPGVSVPEIELRSSGDLGRRSLDLVRMACLVRARTSDAKGSP